MRNENYLEWRENELEERMPVGLADHGAKELLSGGKKNIYRPMEFGAPHGIIGGRSWRSTQRQRSKHTLLSNG